LRTGRLEPEKREEKEENVFRVAAAVVDNDNEDEDNDADDERDEAANGAEECWRI